ncbi:MAG: YIP1 family protein [Xanthomonadaceae bacterium]|nr:YIP1 family protein [Xanthomonadaceae bacterium]
MTEETETTAPPKTPWYVNLSNVLGTILFSPSKFFTAMPHTGRLGQSITLGLIIHWIGVIAQFFWSEVFDQNIEELLKRFSNFTQDSSSMALLSRLKDPNIILFLKLGPVLADPIGTLIKIVISASIIYIAVRLFVDAGKDGAPSEHRVETTVKIYSYSLVPYVFYLVPVVGAFVAPVWSFFVLVQAIKTVYRISTARTFAIVLFPALFVGGLMLIGFFAFLVLGFKMITGFLAGF